MLLRRCTDHFHRREARTNVSVGSLEQLGIVVIGRNEGERLRACLASVLSALGRNNGRIIYVDSGSTDASPDAAEELGVGLIRLGPALPFTAARGRNEGVAALRSRFPDLAAVQFVDGDCTLVRGWCEAALAFLAGHPDVAAVCGRRRERDPSRSIYSSLSDIEWNTPVGEAAACGGDALMRVAAFQAVGGFRSDLVAGEEPEMCVRLREAGWRIWRLDAEMTVHEDAMTRFGQWWRRSVRNGGAFAQVALLHRKSRCAIWGHETARAVAWGGLLPAGTAIGSVVHPVILLIGLLYPAQVARIAAQRGIYERLAWQYGFFMTLGKIAEFQGILGFLARRVGRNREQGISRVS
jgi:GT2 family glycosyltransferase